MLRELGNAYKRGFGEKLKTEYNANHCSVERFSKASVLVGKKTLSLSRECYFFLISHILAIFV